MKEKEEGGQIKITILLGGDTSSLVGNEDWKLRASTEKKMGKSAELFHLRGF